MVALLTRTEARWARANAASSRARRAASARGSATVDAQTTSPHIRPQTALALAWAREQVRLSLQEIVEATPKDQRGRIEATPDTLAWILLAGCEALAHEPASAVADRVRALLELIGHAAPPD